MSDTLGIDGMVVGVRAVSHGANDTRVPARVLFAPRQPAADRVGDGLACGVQPIVATAGSSWRSGAGPSGVVRQILARIRRTPASAAQAPMVANPVSPAT